MGNPGPVGKPGPTGNTGATGLFGLFQDSAIYATTFSSPIPLDVTGSAYQLNFANTLVFSGRENSVSLFTPTTLQFGNLGTRYFIIITFSLEVVDEAIGFSSDHLLILANSNTVFQETRIVTPFPLTRGTRFQIKGYLATINAAFSLFSCLITNVSSYNFLVHGFSLVTYRLL